MRVSHSLLSKSNGWSHVYGFRLHARTQSPCIQKMQYIATKYNRFSHKNQNNVDRHAEVLPVTHCNMLRSYSRPRTSRYALAFLPPPAHPLRHVTVYLNVPYVTRITGMNYQEKRMRTGFEIVRVAVGAARERNVTLAPNGNKFRVRSTLIRSKSPPEGRSKFSNEE